MYGLRGLTNAQWADCESSVWRGIFRPSCWNTRNAPSSIAPPRAPGGDVLTVPPASGDDAQAIVDALLNQQLEDQKALNAAGVESTWWDEIAGDASAAGEKVKSAFPWLLVGGLALGAFALVAVSGGSPRRYGR
jgi:hypothetical protein